MATSLTMSKNHYSVRVFLKCCVLGVLYIQLMAGFQSALLGQSCLPPLISEQIVVEAECSSANGSVEVLMTEDPQLFEFNWFPALGQSNAVGNSRTNLPGGTYALTIIRKSDPTCSAAFNIIVSTQNGPEPRQVVRTSALCGSRLGTVNFNPPNTLIYTWSDGGVGAERTIPSGIYQVTVTDPGQSCENVIEIEVEERGLELGVTDFQTPSCDDPNGAATIIVLSGGSGNYQYSWGPQRRTDLRPGNYRVTVS